MASGDDARPLGGFHSYADDSPRDDAADDAPAPLAAGWSDSPAWRQVDEPPEPPLWRRPVVASCAVLALIGAGMAWAAMRDPIEHSSAPAASDAPTTAPLQVVVAEPPPPPPVAPATERLEVLPPPGVRTARTPLAQVVIPVTTPTPRMVAQAPPDPLPHEAPSAVEAAQQVSVRTEAEPARFDACRDAPSRAYEMVCSDRWLAEADRRMKRAYSAALAAGVPADELRRDQDDWLDVREDAARISRRAVADIYRQRTRELFAMADGRRD